MGRRYVILFALAVFLVWEIVTRGVTAYLAEASPQKAIALRSSQATALLNLAEKALRDLAPKNVEIDPKNADTAPTKKPDTISTEAVGQGLEAATQPLKSADDEPQSETRAKVRSLAERALANDPLNARALRILGQIAIQDSDDKRAELFMDAAVRRSFFESEAIYWMMQRSYNNKNYPAALGYADTLLRTRQNVAGSVVPTLWKIAESQNGADDLRQFLGSNPAWREAFFSGLSGSISDARTPLGIFLSLKDTAAPPTAAELRRYLNFLVDRKFYDLAYYTWLQFLPVEQLNMVGNLFNGGFEISPSGLPFDWVWPETTGFTIEITARSDQEGGHALSIEFGPGRSDFAGTRQLMMLAPGSYQFQGKYKKDLVSQRGLQWRISCAGGSGNKLGESLMVTGQDSQWQNFEFSFSVPEADCPAQYVILTSGARSASEQFLSGTIWFDDLKIVNESVVAPLRGPL